MQILSTTRLFPVRVGYLCNVTLVIYDDVSFVWTSSIMPVKYNTKNYSEYITSIIKIVSKTILFTLQVTLLMF